MERGSQMDWDQEPDLGRVPDTVLARRHGVSSVAVGRARKRRGIPVFSNGSGRPQGARAGIKWDQQPLGEVPDHVLAKTLGVDPTTVASARRVRGIPCLVEKRGIDWDQEPDLGQVPDVELAKRHDVHRRTVASAREHRGIPPYELVVVVEDVTVVGHVHRCPVCLASRRCVRSCDTDLETSEGEPMSYVTCQHCLDELAQQVESGTVGLITTPFNEGRR